MCDPVSITMGVIAVVGAVGGKMESDKMANRQEKAIQDGLALDRAATARQYEQIQKTSMDEQAQLHTNYLIDSARISAMQGESGMQGASHDRVQTEAENNAATDAATLENNRQWQAKQAQTQGVASSSRAQVQLSGIQRQSSVGTALQIAGGVAGAYGNNQKVVAAAQKDKP
uniref:Uncharacterized protein n=1 Tax=Dechloromonas aromatica (strain RCB) TaxID=159087 RepID=Q47D36_DECAR